MILTHGVFGVFLVLALPNGSSWTCIKWLEAYAVVRSFSSDSFRFKGPVVGFHEKWLPWGPLDLRHVCRSKKVLVFGAMEDITNDEYLARSWSPSIVLPSIQFILMSFFSHRRMVKYRESIIFVDVFCLEHDLDALWSLLGSGFWTLWKRVAGS